MKKFLNSLVVAWQWSLKRSPLLRALRWTRDFFKAVGQDKACKYLFTCLLISVELGYLTRQPVVVLTVMLVAIALWELGQLLIEEFIDEKYLAEVEKLEAEAIRYRAKLAVVEFREARLAEKEKAKQESH